MKFRIVLVFFLLQFVQLSTVSSFAGVTHVTWVLGEQWLSWDEDTRFVYLIGYLQGHGRGFRDGCEVAAKSHSKKPAEFLRAKCNAENPEWRKLLEGYSSEITKYYRSYPDDQNVPAFVLLDRMSDSRDLTIEQMKGLGKSYPRMSK